MRKVEIWHGLEREVGAAGSAAFDRARARQLALRPYRDLSAAVDAARRGRGGGERDAIVGALLAEHHATGRSVWTAAAILAMTPLLLSLARRVESTSRERNDGKSIVVAAFLEAVNQIHSADRITLRLYSETRRRVLRPYRPSVEDHARRSGRDVDQVERGVEAGIEALLDQARFVLRARDLAPSPGEKPAVYVERVQPSRSRHERRRRHELLSNQRAASLADLRAAFRSITGNHPHGEST